MRHLLSPLIKAVLRKHYADLARMEDVLRDSGLDWTVIRPPRLTDEALTVPHCERAEPSTWCRDLTRGRRPAHASRARATADDQAGDRDRLLVPGRCRHTGTRRDVGSRSRAIAVGATIQPTTRIGVLWHRPCSRSRYGEPHESRCRQRR